MQVFLYYLIVTDTECVNTGWVKIIGGFRYVRSLDPTVCDFFLWGFIKDNVHDPPLPKTLPELRERIDTAIGNVTQDMFGRPYKTTNVMHLILFIRQICVALTVILYIVFNHSHI